MGEPPLESIARNIELRDGIWFAKQAASVSYPNDGNQTFFEIEDRSFWYRHRNDCIVEAVRNFPPSGPLFDIGGGNGAVAAALQKQGWKIVLVEPDIQGITNARQRGVEHLVCSGFLEAGFRPGSLPALGAFDVVEHVEDDQGFLREIASALQVGGRLVLTVPAYNWLWSIEDANDGHFRRYTLSRLRKLVEGAGLTTEYATYFFTILPPPIFLCRSLAGRMRYRGSQALVNYRRDRTAANIGREHLQQDSWVHKLLRPAWGFEIGMIKRKRRLLFGASCLLVATKK